MKRIVSLLITVCLLLTLCSFNFKTSAQRPDDPKKEDRQTKEDRLAKSLKALWDRLPPQARLGASAEGKAAWERLTPEKREFVKKKVHELINKEKTKLETDKEARKAAIKLWKDTLKKQNIDLTAEAMLSVKDKTGKSRSIKAKKRRLSAMLDEETAAQAAGERKARQSAPLVTMADRKPQGAPWKDEWANSQSFSHPRKASHGKAPAATMPQGGDSDGDGLPDSFEDALANAFTPIYHVSAGETDNFSTFHDSPTQMVKDRLGQTPISHYRVKPLRITYNPYTYRYETFIRIDYLTLWDHDSGLADALCDIIPPFDAVFEGYGPHNLDNERSALLVSAPLVGVYSPTYNLDPNSYSALSLFTAAHEDTFTDQSDYHDFPQAPYPAGNHIELWHSLSKHATYTFNPDYHVLTPEYLVFTIYFVIEYFFFYWIYNNHCNPYWDYFCWPGWDIFLDPWFYIYVAIIYYTTVTIYGCAVERFFEQGGAFANLRINVGEPSLPINGSTFIQDSSEQSKLFQKLTTPLDFESLIP